MDDALTRAQIVDAVGHIDEDQIETILAAGATAAELEMARILADKQDTSDASPPDVRMDVVHRLYDVLRAELPDTERG